MKKLFITLIIVLSLNTSAQIIAIGGNGGDGGFPGNSSSEGGFGRELPPPNIEPTSTEPSKKEQAKKAQQLNNPHSDPIDTKRNHINKMLKLQADKAKTGSSLDWFNDPEVSISLDYTNFDDAVLGSGHSRTSSLNLSWSANERLSFGLTYAENRYESGQPASILMRRKGISGFAHYELTDNYGIGAFLLYDWVDIEQVNNNTFTYGGGLIFTTYHDLGLVEFSSAWALSATDYDVGLDTNILIHGRLSRQWTDQCSSSIYVNYLNTLRGGIPGDSEYIIWGMDVSYTWDEVLRFTIGFEKTELLHDYSDKTGTIDISYLF